MDQKSEKRLEAGWKTITLIGVIMGTGFAGATYIGKYKTHEQAKADHGKLEAATKEVDSKTEELQEEVQEIQMVNVRIEVGQQQISDQLKLVMMQNKTRTTSADREEIRQLESNTEIRGAALKKSYEQRPITKTAKGKMSADDPLSGLVF